MSGEVILNLVKITLLFWIGCLLAVLVWQFNDYDERTKALADTVEASTQRLEQRIDALAAEGVRVAAPAAGPTVGAAPKATDGTDPRTLPFWDTPDNILVSFEDEPRPPDGAPRGGVLRYYTSANPRSLNVHVNNDADLQERICGPVYEYIGTQSNTNPDDYVPGICNRVTVNDDFTVFTCYVRKGMYWHKPYLTQEQKNGRLAWLAKLPPQEVTAHDLKFTFDVVRDPLSECGPLLSYLTDIEKVEVVDRYTFRVTWKRSLYYNKSSTLNLLMIYPRFIYTRDQDGHELEPELVAPTYPQHWASNMMLGTGPFMFDGWEPNQFIRLKRNDDWWCPYKAALDGIHLRIVADRTKQLALFKAGELDVLEATANHYRAEILDGKGKAGTVHDMIVKEKAIMKKWEMFVTYFIGWNMRLPQLREREVRRALAHLYPKDRVIRDIAYGLATPLDGPVHHWASYHVKDLEQFPYDVDKANALLDAAGWKRNENNVREKVVDGKKVELRIKMLYPPVSTTSRDTVLLYQKAAEPAGVLIEPFPREWTVMTKMLDDKAFEGCVLGWGEVWDGNPTQIWHSDSAKTAKGSNMVSYMSPVVDETIGKLLTEFDVVKRKQLWATFQREIVKDQPYCFNYIRTTPWFISTRMGNPYLNKLRPQDWFYPWFVKKGG